MIDIKKKKTLFVEDYKKKSHQTQRLDMHLY